MGSDGFDEFLELIGQSVRMKGFTKYRAQLDNKSKRGNKLSFRSVRPHAYPERAVFFFLFFFCCCCSKLMVFVISRLLFQGISVPCVADTTGEYSVYTEYKDTEVMFHVSTLLPHTASNKQQVRAK